MTDKKSNDSRRKLLKSIVAGSGAVVAGKSLPESWSMPIVDSVILPAHAETTDGTESSPTGTIICSSLDVASGRCEGNAISFYISGEVSESDGSSLEGVSLTVTYSNGETVTFKVLVGANNIFSSGELLVIPTSGLWVDPEATVSVNFTDPKYGSSTCSVPYNCKGKPA